MQVTPGDSAETPIWETCKNIIAKFDDRGAGCIEEIERFTFYKRVRENSYVVVMRGERATYANIILRKGVIS